MSVQNVCFWAEGLPSNVIEPTFVIAQMSLSTLRGTQNMYVFVRGTG